jgi:hypothetical protein
VLLPHLKLDGVSIPHSPYTNSNCISLFLLVFETRTLHMVMVARTGQSRKLFMTFTASWLGRVQTRVLHHQSSECVMLDENPKTLDVAAGDSMVVLR